MKITIIAAVTSDAAIGRGGDMLYHLSDDLKRFKQITMGHPIIMGRKTFQSLPKGALPGRRNIIISRNKNFTAEGAEIYSSLNEAIAACNDASEIMIIGGGEIYRLALPLATDLNLTEIDARAGEQADTFFPALDHKEWRAAEITPWHTDAKTGVRFRYVCLSRK
jgi:dihydrofolate reductase